MMEINDLSYDRDLFIFGENVKTPFGVVRFLSYKEYLLNARLVGLVGQNVLHVYYSYRNQLMQQRAGDDVLKELMKLKEVKLIDLVKDTPELLYAYLMLFDILFDKNKYKTPSAETMKDDGKKLMVLYDRFRPIFESEENFNFVRQLVMDMNLITEEEVSRNEEIQRAIDRSKRMKQATGEKSSFVDIVTSIVATTSTSFEEVSNMTVFQVYQLYARSAAIIHYQTSTLYATVMEKVKIEAWNKHIDLFAKESSTISKDEFDKKFGGLLKM